MPKITTILLDMDGVCCDFVGEACKLHGKSLKDLLPEWEKGGGWNFFKMWGATAAEFWEPINNNSDFWRNLPQYPWYHEMAPSLEWQAEVIYSTSPGSCPTSAYGKSQWLARKGINPSTRAMLGSRKDLMAKPGVVLIDDSDKNCDKFRRAGGSAIVFPQHWNSLHEQTEDPISYVMRELRIIQES